jgi:glycosyltransferase involved in cell wall biosynthesis
MNIAFVTETFPPEANGAAMTAGRLVGGLLAQRHRVLLVRPRQAEASPVAPSEGLQEVIVPGFPLPLYRGVQIGRPSVGLLTRLWTSQRPDLVHIVTEGPLGLSALHAARRLRLPISSGFHTNFHTYMRFYGLPWMRAAAVSYLRWFHNRTAATLVPTEQARLDLQRLGLRNLAVVARGVDTDLYTPQRRRAELRERWRAGRGPVVLHAMRREQPEAKLVVVGDGPLRAGLERSHPEFVFTGTLRGEDLAAHYASADVFLFASLTETFGNVVLEAMASGLAVVAFDDAAAREHIRHGENGLVAAPSDPGAFVRAAVDLARDPALVQRLGAQARQATLSIGWPAVTSRFATLLQRVAEGHVLDTRLSRRLHAARASSV